MDTMKGPGSPGAAIRKIAMLGNHTPRQCGIATFTTDLCQAIGAELLREVHGVPAHKIDLMPHGIPTVPFESQSKDRLGVFGKSVILTFGLLLCRVEDRRGHSHLTAARSKNGVDGWIVDPAPTLLPDPETPYEIASDTSVALATGSIKGLLAWLDEHGHVGGGAVRI